MTLTIFAVFIILIIIGCPIAMTLGIASMAGLLVDGSFNYTIFVQRAFTAVNSFPLMAVPFFMLAGSLMEHGGISKRIIRFTESLVGHLSGGLAVAAILACMIFAAISGSAVATVAAIGGIIVPEMMERKYPAAYSSAVCAAAGTMGPIIPPSTSFVIYASIAGVSVSDIFMGGYIPGVLMGVGLIIYAVITAKKRNLPRSEKASPKEILHIFINAIWALFTPIIILGGIMTGICTPTEAGAISCVYAVIVGVFVYRELTLEKLKMALRDAAVSSSIVMFLIATASVFSWILTIERIPQLVKTAIMSFTDSKYVVLLLINILLLIVGTFMDCTPALTMLVPVLAPLASADGVDLVHLGVVMTINLCIGLLTPPVGTCLFVGCRIGKISLSELVKEIWPQMVVLIVVLLIVTYVPWLSTFLPSLTA